MKIKRFQGTDMRTAIRQVRDTLGSDAVILSNQKIPGGVEIVAAIDYDESLLDGPATGSEANPTTGADRTGAPSVTTKAATPAPRKSRQAALDDIRFSRNIPDGDYPPATPNAGAPAGRTQQPDHLWSQQPMIMEMQNELRSLRGMLVNQLSGLAWGQETRYHPLRARLLQRLLALGMSPNLARQVVAQCDEQQDFDFNWRKALGVVAHQLPTTETDIVDRGGVVALVGPTGVGKTTSIAKLAARYTLRHGPQKVALITTDNYRVAAHEQLRSYARIMGVPMRVAADSKALDEALVEYRDKGLVLIDTAGMGQRDMALYEHLAALNTGGRSVQTYLTLATNSQRGVMNDVVSAFGQVPLSGLILTKLDETTSLGGALSVAIEQNLPPVYLSDGQRVPEDFHPARPHTLVSRSVVIMQQVAAGVKEDDISLVLGGMVAGANG